MNPLQTSQITVFDDCTTAAISVMLKQQHARLAQLDRPNSQCSISARNYDSSIKALGDYLARTGAVLPTKSVLAQWRDDMLVGRADDSGRSYAVRSVNARLSAARKLLRAVADDVTDITVKLVLNDWAKVEDAKATVVQDKTEIDYGRRLTLESLRVLVQAIDTQSLKGLRDRAIISVMAGAGLRVSEVVALTMKDVFSTVNETGQRGIRVQRGKHNKSRIVVLNGWNSWVLQAVRAYTDALGLDSEAHPNEVVFRGVKREKGSRYSSQGERLSARKAEEAVNSYKAEYMGHMMVINCHDLRRTYAKICKQSGMSWEALRANMGHSSVTVTEKYVGLEVDWSERVPNWTIEL
ncbi:MAG: site-specific integrase [Chloroflexi bacterium]|nr:site-specific integrase [Chloroflexota bacterium]